MKLRILKLSLIVLFFFCLTGAMVSPINEANFKRIEIGMTLDDVIKILGRPNRSSTLSVGQMTGTTVIWENRNGKISLIFFNGQVKVKQYYVGVTTPREG